MYTSVEYKQLTNDTQQPDGIQLSIYMQQDDAELSNDMIL